MLALSLAISSALSLPYGGLELFIALFVLVIIGVVIIMIMGALILFIPAAVIAFVVWWLTGSEFWAAVAFLIVSVFSLLKRR
jgi:hypothetical protein